MKNMVNADTIECRGVIRSRAFELAESGAFTDWRAIRLALRSLFPANRVDDILASLFCRLDLNLRCDKAIRQSLSNGYGHVQDSEHESAG
ncbi:hypothetical protein AB4Y38_41600 [Paraburkholderia sp. EG285A]|uniref:hypothetical protein n=1 Tax=Paraburkholderia sp. EG285A TaxID=3237009 RepID=UPI0034D2A57A